MFDAFIHLFRESRETWEQILPALNKCAYLIYSFLMSKRTWLLRYILHVSTLWNIFHAA